MLKPTSWKAQLLELQRWLRALLESGGQAEVTAALNDLPPDQRACLMAEFFQARESQLPPDGDWIVWLVLAGRGFGKTRIGSEWINHEVQYNGRRRLALVGATAADVRDVMVEGESGILAKSNPLFRPTWEPSKRRLTWPNDAIATTYSADEPDRLRGPQHDGAWTDEGASWRYPDAWDQLMFGLRIGADPRCVMTTTPRPTKFIKALMADPSTVVTRGTTYENLDNLAVPFRNKILAKYEGTRLGEQELLAKIIEDAAGALWKRGNIDEARVRVAPAMRRIVVAIDPSGTANAESDECGIGVAGIGIDGHGYILDDLSGVMSPGDWGALTVALYHKHKADRVVAETNFGGDMVELTLRGVCDKEGKPIGKSVAFKKMTASRS
ncbi:MAG: terminase family protein, partial [Nocardioides sp.]